METLELSHLVPLYDPEGVIIGSSLVEAVEIMAEELNPFRPENSLCE